MINHEPYIYNYFNGENKFYIMREDLLPFSFGGNKVRKNLNYFEEIRSDNYTHVVTYGSKSSNHARIVANLSSKYGLKCTIITPESNENITYNTDINSTINAKTIYTPLSQVKETIQKTLDTLKYKGEKPYFIQGGGHGFLGTKAYVDTFKYISDYSNVNNFNFDYIFLASGTGATQAGLIIGNDVENYSSIIVGISVARKSSRGSSVIERCIEEYYDESGSQTKSEIDIIFRDDYLAGGYGKFDEQIERYIVKYMSSYGVPLDPTYTGKAVTGMHNYLEENDIKDKNILFIHTGGTPLYFSYLKEKYDA